MFARPRPFLSILAGLVVLAILPVFSGDLRGVTRFLVGWDVGVGLYLALAFRMFVKSDAAPYRPTVTAPGRGRSRDPRAYHRQRCRKRRRDEGGDVCASGHRFSIADDHAFV